MSFAIETVQSESTLLVKFIAPEGRLSNTVNQCREIIQRTAQLLETRPDGCYRIYDFSDAHIPFSHLAMLFAEEGKARPGSIFDPRVRTVVVCSDTELVEEIQRLYRRYAPRNPGSSLPVFHSMVEALKNVHSELNIDQYLSELLVSMETEQIHYVEWSQATEEE